MGGEYGIFRKFLIHFGWLAKIFMASASMTIWACVSDKREKQTGLFHN